MSKAKPVSSDFNKDADGWTMYGDYASAGWEKKGGNPGGYFTWTDKAQGDAAYYVAPDKFLGNDKAYYGGTITYDVIDSKGSNLTGDPDLVLSDGQHFLVGFAGATVGTSWTQEAVMLDSKHLYDANPETMQITGPASASEIKATLSNLAYLLIRAEYWSGTETGGLDNVVLSKGGPASSAGAAAHLSAGAMFAIAHGSADMFHHSSPLQSLEHGHLAIA